MKTKTIKNTLLQSVAYGPHAAFMASRLKASFHASPAAIMALLAKHRLQQSKNLALRAEKPGDLPQPLPRRGAWFLPFGEVRRGFWFLLLYK